MTIGRWHGSGAGVEYTQQGNINTMIDQKAAAQPQTTTHERGETSLAVWLRRKLAPHNDNLGHWVSYVMIVGAMALFVLWQDNLPAWRFYGTLGALSALLTVNTPAWADATGFHDEDPAAPSTWVFFLVSAALVFLAFWLSIRVRESFIPYLLFMLAGQATATVPLRWALSYSVALLGGFAALLWLVGAPLLDIFGDVMTTSMGMVFVIMFTIIAVRYGEQTARAEALLANLRTANAELAAARQRERDLAVAEERVRLARDIHDGLGHHLTVLNVQLQAAAKLVRTDPSQAAATIGVCRDVAQAALAEVRQSVAAMRATPLDKEPLHAALKSLVEQFDQRSPVDARFILQGTPVPVAPQVAMTLYRAAQEGLTNLQKHADAQHAVVTLRFMPDSVSLLVENDGTVTGARSSTNGGFGLAGLRERAEQLGGSFTAAPLADGGFQLNLTLPVKHATVIADC
jgi:signal transduction histidine kinase